MKVEEVLEKYDRLIKSIVYHYSSIINFGEITEEDLYQEACIAVITKLPEYDSKKSKLSTYISNHVKYRILNYINGARLYSVHIPHEKAGIISLIIRAKRMYFEKHGKEISDVELFNELKKYNIINTKYDIDYLKNLEETGKKFFMMNTLSFDEDINLIYGDIQDKILDKVFLDEMFKKLTKEELYIIKSMFGIDYDMKSCVELAEEFKCSDKNIYKIRKRALEKMKQNSNF